MMEYSIIIIAKCLGAALIAVLAGFGAVDFFNGMPASWLTDYGAKPTAEVLDRSRARVQRTPWAYLFSILFALLYIRFIMIDIRFFMSAAIAMWALVEMSICDIRFRIVPDQLIIILGVTALGFIPFIGAWRDSAGGLVLGLLLMLAMAATGRLIYRKTVVGGADIKVFAALGLSMGVRGILAIFIITSLSSAIHGIYIVASKRGTLKDGLPMLPHIALAAGIYLSILWQVELELFI